MSETAPGPNVVTSTNTAGGASPYQIGVSASSKVGFFGITPTTQPTNAAQAALTLTTATASGGFAFTTTTGFSAMLAQLENIRASLVLLGILKGS